MATIDPLEVTPIRPAMGEGREYENARHEPERAERGSLQKFEAALAKVRDVEAQVEDRLSNESTRR